MTRRSHSRLGTLAALAVAVAALVSGCGDAGEPAAPPGSPENPLVAEPQQETGGRSNEASSSADGEPGFESLVERQSSDPASRFTPCLLSRSQARSILGVPVVAPVEAPQGPTCIYRSESGRSFVTLSVQALDFDELAREMRQRRSLEIADRPARCGVHGRPTLYVSLPRDRVLAVAAPCAVAQRFAAAAVERLGS